VPQLAFFPLLDGNTDTACSIANQLEAAESELSDLRLKHESALAAVREYEAKVTATVPLTLDPMLYAMKLDLMLYAMKLDLMLYAMKLDLMLYAMKLDLMQ
jgi:hypothetical protein